MKRVTFGLALVILGCLLAGVAAGSRGREGATGLGLAYVMAAFLVGFAAVIFAVRLVSHHRPGQ